MTQEFTVVSPEMWGDERFVNLNDDAKLLWIRLLTGPEVTGLPGLLAVGRAALAEAMGWSTKKFDRAFEQFDRTDDKHPEPMAIADWRARVVWLPRACGHRRRPKNQNQVTGWRDSYRNIPECVLKRRAAVRIREFLSTLGDTFVAAFDDISGNSNMPKSSPSLDSGVNTSHQTTVGLFVEQIPVDPAFTRAPARSDSPSLSNSLSAFPPEPPCQVAKLPEPETVVSAPPPKPPDRIVDLGSATGHEACLVFVATLAEVGWVRPDVQERWERQALCDAANKHLRADETLAGMLAELRRAVREWAAAYAAAPQFTSGWGARKFSEWLSTGRTVVARRAEKPHDSQRRPKTLPVIG